MEVELQIRHMYSKACVDGDLDAQAYYRFYYSEALEPLTTLSDLMIACIRSENFYWLEIACQEEVEGRLNTREHREEVLTWLCHLGYLIYEYDVVEVLNDILFRTWGGDLNVNQVVLQMILHLAQRHRKAEKELKRYSNPQQQNLLPPSKAVGLAVLELKAAGRLTSWFKKTDQ